MKRGARVRPRAVVWGWMVGLTGASAVAQPTVAWPGYTRPGPIPVAPGQILTFFVTGIQASLSAPVVAASLPLPLSLAGISVTIRSPSQSYEAPLFSVAPMDPCTPAETGGPGCPVTAITIQAPYEISPNGGDGVAASCVVHRGERGGRAVLPAEWPSRSYSHFDDLRRCREPERLAFRRVCAACGACERGVGDAELAAGARRDGVDLCDGVRVKLSHRPEWGSFAFAGGSSAVCASLRGLCESFRPVAHVSTVPFLLPAG
jgi:hypothetical protein